MGPAILGAAKGLSWLGAGLGGLLGIGSSAASNIGAKNRQNLANSQNIEFWNKQNAYNTPKAQMARLKAAGLNPALIYGSGATNTGVAGSIAPSKPAPYNIKDPTPTAMNAAMLASQIRLQDSQSSKNNAETEQTLGLTPGRMSSQNTKAEIDKIKLQVQTNTTSAQIKTIIANADLKGLETTIKAEDANMATAGFVKGNYIGTIFRQLGLNPSNPTDKKIIQGIIGTMLGSTIFKNLSGTAQQLLKSFTKR